MAAEQFANLGKTTLSAGYTSGSGALTVTSTTGSPAFSAAAPFRIAVVDQSTGAVTVILKVTAITDGTHFAVMAEGSDASANSGDFVYQVLTAGGLDGLRSALSRAQSGSLPTDGRDGDILIPSDESVFYRHNGTIFVPFGPQIPNLVNPRLTTFTWRNQGGASVVQTAGTEYLLLPTDGGTDLRVREISAPSTPYTITAVIQPQIYGQAGPDIGLFFCDGTKLVEFAITFDTTPRIIVNHWNSVTSYASTPLEATYWNQTGFIVLRATDDGTNLIFSWSLDNVNFFQFRSEARGGFLSTGPTSIGYGGGSGSGTFPAAAKLLSWKQT